MSEPELSQTEGAHKKAFSPVLLVAHSRALFQRVHTNQTHPQFELNPKPALLLLT